jgi:hypothetical protein
MKKQFIAGFLTAALIFGAVPAFANTVSSLIGSKVTGVFTINDADGKKIAEAAIINGSAYVPVRAMSEATGTDLTVTGKVITLGETTKEVDETGATLGDVPVEVTISKLQTEKEKISKKITGLESGIASQKETAIPMAEELLKKAVTDEEKATGESRLEKEKKRLSDAEAEVTELKSRLVEIETQLAELLGE